MKDDFFQSATDPPVFEINNSVETVKQVRVQDFLGGAAEPPMGANEGYGK